MTEQERDPQADAAGAADDPEGIEPDDDEALDAIADDGDEAPDDEGAETASEAAIAAPAAHRRDRAPGKVAAAAPSVSEVAVHVSDRGSAAFVLGVVGVFVLILLYGMLLGRGGFITGVLATPTPAPTPVPTRTVAPATPTPSVSPSAAPSASPSAAPSPSPSVAPSPSPSAS